jgi:primary-amine oxidase
MIPNKTDALMYVDGSSSPPDRYAHVVLDNRATEDAHYQDILVGPLPVIVGTTAWSPLQYTFTRKTKGKVRNLDADADTLYDEWLNPIGASVADITMDLWGGAAAGLDNDTIEMWGVDPLFQEDGRIVRWDTFWNVVNDNFQAGSLLPLGLFVKSDVTGRDPANWTIEGWLYDDIFYETTEAFRDAYWSNKTQKLGPNTEGDWARTDRQGSALPMDTASPPAAVAPSGSRFSVDYGKKYIEWMDFSFYIAFSRDLGMTLYDIRYKGTRIIYELGLQEALAHYAGNDPVQGNTAYLDGFYGFGPYAFELVNGYDCPSYATYLNSSFYVDETTHIHVNSICLFEFDADFAIQRHTTDQYVSSTKNIQFTARSVSTIGNYDYTFSYTFLLDGSIAVDVRASGYIQSAYYARNGDYGYKIHDNLSGSMHDHVMNFKADFDVLGRKNTVELVKVTPVTRSFSWSGGKTRNTMALARSSIASENESRLNWDANGQTQLVVINTDSPNRFGEYPGYRIAPSTPPQHLTVQDSSALVDAARWANHDVQITLQKDTEPRSSHSRNNQDTHNPPVNFDAFFNGESLLQEDLVLWLNMGMHHVPHTGDLPNTVMITAHAGLRFSPHNYLESDPSRQTANMMRLVYKKGKVSEVELFGQGSAACPVDYAPVKTDYFAYTGDVVVRKFPYDPNNPYFETESIA